MVVKEPNESKREEPLVEYCVDKHLRLEFVQVQEQHVLHCQAPQFLIDHVVWRYVFAALQTHVGGHLHRTTLHVDVALHVVVQQELSYEHRLLVVRVRVRAELVR